MTAPRNPDQILAMMARETALSEGLVPRELAGLRVEAGSYRLEGAAFLLRCESGLGFHYRQGHGVTVERPAGHDPAEEQLMRNGSVYAAIAAINGLLPIHASAVSHNDGVYAFTGPSGAGKSTLAAALGREGLPLFCDDTLVLDPSGQGPMQCLPGHKRLKLLPDALALSGASAEEEVGSETGKRYALPAAGTDPRVLPLRRLVVLEDGDEQGLFAAGPAERFALLNDDHYTAELYGKARGGGLAERFDHIARLAAAIPVHRFVRPRDPARFADGVARIAAAIRAGEFD